MIDRLLLVPFKMPNVFKLKLFSAIEVPVLDAPEDPFVVVLGGVKVADKIANLSQHAVMMIKEAINRGFATTLAEGVRFERRIFHSLFATEDQKEGMAAFIEKRKPKFKNR